MPHSFQGRALDRASRAPSRFQICSREHIRRAFCGSPQGPQRIQTGRTLVYSREFKTDSNLWNFQECLEPNATTLGTSIFTQKQELMCPSRYTGPSKASDGRRLVMEGMGGGFHWRHHLLERPKQPRKRLPRSSRGPA